MGWWRPIVCFVGLLSACRTAERANDEKPTAIAPAPATPAISQAENAAAECARAIEETLRHPALPGAPALDAVRDEILMRAKARPVLFLNAPEPAQRSASAAYYWKHFERASTSALSFYSSYATLARQPAVARELFLREGYLYADQVQLAMGLANSVRLEDLFTEQHVWIHRGSQILQAERHMEAGEPLFRYADGPEKGQRATLLLFDRVSSNVDDLAQPLHRDFSEAQRELGFEAVRIEQLSDAALVAQLRYGDIWVRTLLRSEDGGRLALQCEMIEPGQAAAVEATRRHSRLLLQVMAKLREIVHTQLEESLPFDEPKTEFGQEDGKLRQEWTSAYRFGRSHYEYNEDRYRVFDHQGRPRPPQVCIDFITDTLERASGTWYQPRGVPRERIRGRLDFNDFGIENRRSVESFVLFAEQHPQWFGVKHLTAKERIPFRQRGAFFDYLRENRAHFRVGDVVTILGLREDDDREHYHSFFVFDVDPITQMPIWLASNAGRPRIRVWENELGNAPKRSIKSVIRPQLSWLAEVVLGQREALVQ